MTQYKTADPRWRNLYKIGGIAALMQLAAILAMLVAMVTLGPKPTSVEEYFILQQSNRLQSILQGDFLLLFLIGPYIATFPALYVALRRVSPVGTALATLMTLVVVAGFFAMESTFSLQYLGNKYAAAAGDAQRAQFLAAGEAVVASDIWNSSGAYIGGILLQGAGVIMSVIMLRSKDFSKVTAWAGLLGNGVDLVQHVINPFAPSISAFLKPWMGLFYIVWFPMLARDFFRLGRNTSMMEETR